MAEGLSGCMSEITEERMERLRPIRSVRDSPSFWAAPAVRTIMSAWPASLCVAARILGHV